MERERERESERVKERERERERERVLIQFPSNIVNIVADTYPHGVLSLCDPPRLQASSTSLRPFSRSLIALWLDQLDQISVSSRRRDADEFSSAKSPGYF